jgi:hypothetical protein
MPRTLGMDKEPTLRPLESVTVLELCVMLTGVYNAETLLTLVPFDRYTFHGDAYGVSRWVGLENQGSSSQKVGFRNRQNSS